MYLEGKKARKYSGGGQERPVQLNSLKIHRLLKPNIQLIMDAEKYYTSTTLNDVKLKFQAKVEPKLLIWVTMPLKGIIRAYIHRNKIVVDAETYLNVCIQKRLILFIE